MPFLSYLAVFFFALISASSALYDSSDDVIELTPAKFSEVTSGDEIWLVEFYAPWCGHCQQLAPEWKKAARALKGIVKVAAIDVDQHQSVGSQYGIQGFPTIKVFAPPNNKQQPSEYNGGRTADAIVEQALSIVSKTARAKLSGGSESGSYGSSRGGGSSSSGGDGSGSGSGDGSVVELTEANFKAKVLDSDEPWLVEFFAPWCGHCKNLKPHWDEAAAKLKGKVMLGAVDATVHQALAQQYGVRGYPTIKFFAAGVKTGVDSAKEYDGGRTADDIVRWAEDKAAASLPPPELHQLTGLEKLRAACEKNQLCVFAVLPQLLDCQAKCRNEHLDMLRGAADKFKQQGWGWLWAEAVSQPKVEKAFGLGGFGYPAMVIVNARKGQYATLRGPFNEAGVHEFLRAVSYGKGSTQAVALSADALFKEETVKTVESWDGKDGVPPVEEEIDLSELGIETPKQKKTEL